MVVSCSECNRSYKNKNSLKTHRNTYHKSGRFENYPKKMTDSNKEESSDSNTDDEETTNEEVSDQYTSSNDSQDSNYRTRKVAKRKSQRVENNSSDSDESFKKTKKLKKRLREDVSSDESLDGRKRRKGSWKCSTNCSSDEQTYEVCATEHHTRFIQTIFQMILDGSIPLEPSHVSQLKYYRDLVREVAYCDLHSAEKTLRYNGSTAQNVLKTISTLMPGYFGKLFSIYN